MPNILMGYLAAFLFIASVILVGEIVHKKYNTDKELTRKVEHTVTGFGWAICYFFFGSTYHMVIINAITLVLLVVITFTGAMSSVERGDSKRSYGLVYFGIGTMINILVAIFADTALVPLNAIAYFTLTLADGAAPIAARLAGKKNRQMFAPKTLVGFLSVFLVTAAVTTVCSLVFGLSLTPLFIISVACIAAHAELYGMKGLDNLTIPMLVFGYLALNHYGFVSVGAQIAISLLLPITVLATLSGALTYLGGLLSFVYFTVSSLIAPPSVVAVIMILFIAEAVVSKLVVKIGKIKKKSHPRGGYQIFANVFASLVFVLLYAFTQRRIFMLVTVVVLAEEFADSVASAVGRLSRNKPIDIIRLKRVERGISGGISPVGSLSAAIAAFLGVAILFVFEDMSLVTYLTASVIAFFGTIIDSILGSSVQSLYKCNICGSLTESKTHCTAPAERIKGIFFVDNATVNLLSALLTAALSLALLPLVQ